VRDLANPVADVSEIQNARPDGRFRAQHQVLGNGQGWHQHEVLVDHADAAVDGLAG
jgi:hypothetical protein